MFENEKAFQNKKELGFRQHKQKKSNTKSYVSKTKKYFGYINCFYCNKKGHYIKDFFYL